MLQPAQARSQRTLSAILDAAEALLARKPFEDISIAEIILKAGSSTGSFYARFRSKDDLLPALYDRYDEGLPDRVAQIRERLDQSGAGLRALCAIIVDAFARSFEDRPNLMRAIVIYARTPGTDLSEISAKRAVLLHEVVGLFEPYHAQIRHDRVAEAIRTGLFIAATSVREAILFPDAPFAANASANSESIKRAAAHALHAFLTSEGDTE